ncbi:CLUMA_CG000553, isoform A [Clunio marinus]|uniref:MMS19 nucleotide excision repair protein n=1 Tax=Clunio marinus TaxID=568069 RepID=A0A1J1HFF0_9DIPT|nr:CLUMA_CG000553, isoform A [Clunio marinus]
MKFPWSTSIVDVLKNDNKLDEKLQEIVKALTHHKEDITQVVEELGPALTHKDVEIRLKGMEFLSDLLRSLPKDLLDEKALGFIVAFYCDRMKDHHSISPQVIIGLVAIIKMKNLPRSSPVLVLQQIFANIPCQTQVRGDRANIFTIIQYLSDNYQVELQAMGADFIYGVIQAVEGERDPRNLVFLFEFMPRFINTYPLRHLSEEMFEVFSCYFPIDFFPSPNDPQAITRDILAEKLSVCLCASKEFAENCFALALEKLETDVKVAKLDSLNLLIKAVTNFEPTSVLEKFDEIWQFMKLELLSGAKDKDVNETALAVISAVLKKFKSDQANSEIILNKIFTNTIGTLLNRDSNLYKPTMELVLKCANATDISCGYVINKVLPITLTDLTSNEELTVKEKCEVLEDFRQFMMIVGGKKLLAHYIGDNYILQIQKELMKVLMTPSSEDLTKVTCLVLQSMADIISDENRQIVYKSLKENLTRSTEEQRQCILAFAKVFPKEVRENVLESFLSRTYEDANKAKNVFATLSFLLEVSELRDSVIEVLSLNLFNNKNLQVQLVVLEVLNKVLSSENCHQLARILFDEWRIVIKLMDLIKNENPDEGQDVMYQASLVMSLVVRTLPNDQQMALVEKYLPLMKLNESIPDLYVTSGLLGFLDAAVPMEAHFETLVNELTKLSLHSNDEVVRKLANQLLCSLFNRAPIDDKHRKILRKIYDVIKEEVKKHNHQAVEILGWISKGLLARGHPDAAEILETLSELLDHPKLSKSAELAFEIISLEFPQLHLPLLKHFFKQRIFVLALKFLENKIEKYSEHHLTAMAHILQITPHQALKMNLEKVGPILFKCVQIDPEDPKPHSKRILLSLKIINNFIHDKNQYILNHLQHLVNDLLKLSQFKPSMDVRIMACKCLENITKYPLFTLVPYKSDVIHELTIPLDDHKRLVRNAAVSARMAWFLLGENDAAQSSK